MSELGEKQEKFMWLLPRLIDFWHARGYKTRGKDLWRNPVVFGEIGHNKAGAYGHPSSCHKIGLAIDLALFKDGEYLQTTEDHRPGGEYWESLDPDCVWGGRFKDGNHYSIKYRGIR